MKNIKQEQGGQIGSFPRTKPESSFFQIERGEGTVSEGSEVKEMEKQDGQEARDFERAEENEKS